LPYHHRATTNAAAPAPSTTITNVSTCIISPQAVPRRDHRRRPQQQPSWVGVKRASRYNLAMKLYWGSGSPVSWRIQIALALKSTPYSLYRLNLGAHEHRGDAYRAVNPRGTFPVLTDGDLVLRESLAILAYLERKQPTPPLFGESPETHAMVWQQVIEHDQGLAADADIITRALFRDGGLDDGTDKTSAALQRPANELHRLDKRLQNNDWRSGNAPNALEVVNYPTLQRLLRAASRPHATHIGLDAAQFKRDYPGLMDWADRMVALPGIDATYPPHWRA